MKKKYRVRDYNFILLLMVVAVTIIGILAIGSAKESLQSRQMMGLVLGFFLMIVLSVFDYSFFLKFYWIIYGLSIALLAMVMFLGKSAGGAQRWINIAGIQFQPSEAAKILLILFYAQFIMLHKEQFNKLKTIGSMILLFIPPLFLIYNQPDMSTSIVLLVLFVSMMFIGGLSWKIILAVLAIAIPAFIIFFSLVLQPDQQIINNYQQTRILAWLYPDQYSSTEGYQQANSIMAIGSGMFSGKGLNNNSITSVKNGNFISEPQTDFIFAVIGEEMGFVGSAVTVILLFGIALICFNIGRRAKDLAGSLICGGVGILIGFQSFVNISVATGMIPNTGIPLPFISYGLTSLLCLYMGIGFVLNVGLQCVRNQDKEKGREDFFL